MELIYVGTDKSNILLTKCTSVVSIETEVKPYITDMIQIAIDNNLIGLSAPQVGLDKEFFVWYNSDGWEVVINPNLKGNKQTGRKFDWESCGSVKNMEYLVERWVSVDVSYTTLEIERVTTTLKDFPARVFQHETDHLK